MVICDLPIFGVLAEITGISYLCQVFINDKWGEWWTTPRAGDICYRPFRVTWRTHRIIQESRSGS